MRAILHILYHPLSIFAFLVLASFIFKAQYWFWVSRLFWFLSGLWILFLIFSPVPFYLMRDLEQEYPSLYEIPKDIGTANILVLASGFTHDTSLLPNDQLGNHMLKRLSEGLRLYHLSSGKAKLYISGPKGKRAKSQAYIASLTAKNMAAIPKEDILIIENGNITWEELQAYAEITEPNTPLLLVTAASHQKRAMAMAEALKLPTIPAPTAHRIIKESYEDGFWEIGIKGIPIMSSYFREKLGLLYFNIFIKPSLRRTETPT